MAKFDVRVQSTAQVDEVIAVLDGTGRVRYEHADPRVGLRQDHALDDLEEFRIVVDPGFEIVREYRDLALGLPGNPDYGVAHLVLSRD